MPSELLSGVVLKTYPCAQGTYPHAEELLKVIGDAKPAFTMNLPRPEAVSATRPGTTKLPPTFIGTNFTAVVDGYLFAPWSDIYLFGTNTQGSGYIIIDGIEASASPWMNYQDDSYDLGWPVRLERGCHSFRMVNLHPAGREVYVSAGWRLPGSPFPKAMPSACFRRFALYEPTKYEERDSGEYGELSIQSRYSVRINGDRSSAHIDARLAGSSSPNEWAVLDGSGRKVSEFSKMTASMILAQGMEWRIVVEGAKGKLEFPMAPAIVQPEQPLDVSLSWFDFPSVVFEEQPFSGALAVENGSTYECEYELGVTTHPQELGSVFSDLLRTQNTETVQFAADWNRHPFVILPRGIFENDHREPIPPAEELRFELRMFGLAVGKRTMKIVKPEDDLQIGARFRNGILTDGSNDLSLLAVRDSRKLSRRWAAVRALRKAVSPTDTTLIVGDSRLGDGKSLQESLASAMESEGHKAIKALDEAAGDRLRNSLAKALEIAEQE
jgi:hypothetical protein